ncbi:MAG TPA: PIG-L family deacetylase [Sedimentisphaerales bacterium]|nr:PIG-L family deacetylase [Sedimentisphaerales bacterium]HRS12963.1 PIG-L family deacetylase [Sedimentisphaerales bacterium]HRV49612.1 PIG-L family deacetylase [Sedimentisphaerales bacterium]
MLTRKRTAVMSLLCVLTMALLGTAKTSLASERAGHPADDGKLRIIVFGAHPDDCEIKAGGTAALWAAQGHHVKFVSTTNGDIGHAETAGGPLAKRRTAEVKEAAKVLGIECEVLDIHDGELMPTLENRKTFVRLIREWKADIVMGHRPNDYHPDHRYTGILMQDAAYMVTVAFFCPDVPQLAKNPVFLYLSDNFQKPTPFDPAIVVGIDSVYDKKMDAIWKLQSQIESLWATGDFEKVVPVPTDPAAREQRRRQVAERFAARDRRVADKYRHQLIEDYGPEKGAAVRCAEAFELCEYGRQPSPEELKALFPIQAGR